MAGFDEFMTYWGRLSPEEQEQFAYTFGMGAMNQPVEDEGFEDFTFGAGGGGLGGVPGTQLGFMQQAAGFPMVPMTDYSNDLGLLMEAAIPTLTAKGAVDPYDLPQATQRLNYAQDIGGSMFDNAVALFAGPDAWGDPKQFEPVTTYTGDPVPMGFDAEGNPVPVLASDRKRQDFIANGGYEGFLAEMVGEEGMTPGNAMAALLKYVTDQEAYAAAPAEEKAKIDQVRATMPVMWNETIGPDGINKVRALPENPTAADYDRESLMSFATSLYDEKLADDLSAETLFFDEASGQYFPGRKVEDSASALKFRNAGLPTPNQRFDDPEYIEQALQTIQPGYQYDVADWQTGIDEMGRSIQGEADWARKADTNQRELDSAWSEFQNELGQRTSAGSVRDPENTAAGRVSATARPQAPRVWYDANGNAHLASDREITERKATDAANEIVNRFSFGIGQRLPTGQGRENARGGVGRLNQGDITNAGRRTAMHRDNYTRQYNDRWSTVQQGAPGAMDRAALRGQLRAQAALGQTPLQVAMLARLASLGQRTGG